VVFSTYFASEFVISKTALDFVRQYRIRNRKEPAAATALGYDGYVLALEAIQRAGSTDPRRIRDAIADTRGFVGVSGTVSLDENGDANKHAFIKTVKNGDFFYKAFLGL
jgi:branched-chain amino acid transport system substrate-binding protein